MRSSATAAMNGMKQSKVQSRQLKCDMGLRYDHGTNDLAQTWREV
jgi:hypothetical protein